MEIADDSASTADTLSLVTRSNFAAAATRCEELLASCAFVAVEGEEPYT